MQSSPFYSKSYGDMFSSKGTNGIFNGGKILEKIDTGPSRSMLVQQRCKHLVDYPVQPCP
jgi:hypothetical protein